MNPFESYPPPNDPPTACGAIELPTPSTPNCADDYNAHESEITDLWICGVEEDDENPGTWVPTAPPTNWKSLADLNATTGLHHIVVIGDKPLGEPVTAALAKKWVKVVDRTHTLNIDQTDVSEANYEFFRTLQHGAKVAIWWATYGGWVAGGENGVICDVQNAGTIWGRGDGTLMTNQVIFTWKNKFDPPAVIANNTPSPLKAVKPKGETPAKLSGGDVKGAATADAKEDAKATSKAA